MASLADINSNPKASPYVELGISGVTRWGGVSRVYEEFLRELQGPAGMKLLREQTDNCPVTGAFLFASEYLSRQATMRVEPSKAPGIDVRRAEAVARRVEAAIFEDMDTTWPDTLSDILTMLPFGWAAMEMVFKRCRGWAAPTDIDSATGLPKDGTSLLPSDRLPSGQGVQPSRFVPSKFNDGFVGFKKWGLRAQETLFMWEWDSESNPLVLQQMAPPDYRVRRVPLTKCLHFRTKVAKNNPEGRSILRNSVPSYLYRKNLQWVESVGIERDLAGYPVFQVIDPDPARGLIPPDIWNSADPAMAAMLNRVQSLVKAVRRDEQEGMVLPWWLKFTLVNGGSRRQFDTNAIIQRYDQRIAMTVMADFIMLGHEAVGSKALASTKSSLFTSALNAFLDIVCATINRTAMPLLMKLNGIPMDYCPTIKHSDVENVPLDVIGAYIQSLAGAGMPLFPNPDLEEALMDAAKLPTTGVAESPMPLPGVGQPATPPQSPVPQPAGPGPLPTANKSISKRRQHHSARRY